MQISLSVRLRGGNSDRQGRVEVYADGDWGTVCDDLWGKKDADVVCEQLGFLGSSGFTIEAKTFGEGSGEIFMDNVECKGDEWSIIDCPQNPIGRHNCGHHEDAGVICQGKSPKSPNKILLLLLLRNFFFRAFVITAEANLIGGGGV